MWICEWVYCVWIWCVYVCASVCVCVSACVCVCVVDSTCDALHACVFNVWYVHDMYVLLVGGMWSICVPCVVYGEQGYAVCVQGEPGRLSDKRQAAPPSPFHPTLPWSPAHQTAAYLPSASSREGRVERKRKICICLGLLLHHLFQWHVHSQQFRSGQSSKNKHQSSIAGEQTLGNKTLPPPPQRLKQVITLTLA